MPNPTCPTDCTSALPPVGFDDCNPEVNLSEIVRIFVGKSTSSAFTTPATATEWTTRVSETSVTGDNYLRPLTVIGDKPAPTPVTKELSNGRTKVIRKDHVINFTIDDTNTVNHEFLRTVECGGRYRIWYETAAGLMYGGSTGILVNMNLDMILNRGADEHQVMNGTLTWKSKFTEERFISPIFGNPMEG